MQNLYAVKVYNGYCGCDNCMFIICEAASIDEYAEEEMVSNAESFYDEDDGDYDEYMENCGYFIELVESNFTGSQKDAEAKWRCPSLFV